jgi:hypothetical protein
MGEYQFSPEFSITITIENGRLHGQPTGQTKSTLYAESPEKFFLRSVDAQVTFTKDQSGAVTGLILHQGGRDQTGRKVK